MAHPVLASIQLLKVLGNTLDAGKIDGNKLCKSDKTSARAREVTRRSLALTSDFGKNEESFGVEESRPLTSKQA